VWPHGAQFDAFPTRRSSDLDYRDLRLGRRLYDARKELCEQLNLKSIIAGGRIPKYHEHADTLTPKQYIEKVKQKELYDPTLTFQDRQSKRLNSSHVKNSYAG